MNHHSSSTLKQSVFQSSVDSTYGSSPRPYYATYIPNHRKSNARLPYAQKSNSSVDDMTVGSSPSPMPSLYSSSHNNIHTSTINMHALDTQSIASHHSNLLPSINYSVNNQHSNKSNNSNSTHVSFSNTIQSSTTSLPSSFSDLPHSSYISNNPTLVQLQHRPTTPSVSQSQSQSTLLQSYPAIIPIHPSTSNQLYDTQSLHSSDMNSYTPSEVPSLYLRNNSAPHHSRISNNYNRSSARDTTISCPPHMLARSSTPSINLIELEQMAKIDDEKQTPSIHMRNVIIPSISSPKHQRRATTAGTTPSSTWSPSMLDAHARISFASALRNTHSTVSNSSSSKQLELSNFDGDVRSYNIWIACSGTNPNVILWYALYPKLCEYLMDVVGCSRCPKYADLQSAFMMHGAEANKYKNDSRKVYLSIDQVHFVAFWKWFKQACMILKELKYLWDVPPHMTKSSRRRLSSIQGLGLDLFCQRTRCEQNLLQSPEGTFMLRLSSSVCGGVVLSYVEHAYSDVTRQKLCKHVILIRQDAGMYLCNKKVMSLHDIVRHFVKLKLLYTPTQAIAKSKIF